MKGSGTTIAAIIILLMIIISTGFIILLIFNNLEKERRLNIEEALIIRTKNIFYLFNKSLATTWLVSSAQAAFASENIEDYWYRTDPSSPKSTELPSGLLVTTSSCPDPNSLLIYVDKQTALPVDYEPSDLVLFGNHQVRSVIVNNLNAIIDAAKAEGVNLFIVSAYRSYETQASLFENYVQQEMAKGYLKEEAERRANTYSARAGHSEHQLGTAIDFNSVEDSFAGTREQLWLEQHAEEYGFILSYPEGKPTGYQYEPWHYRYVGKDIARELKSLDYLKANNDWTLNKYLRERCASNSAKCNNGNPRICLPYVPQASQFMKEELSDDIEEMKIKGGKKLQEIEVDIEDMVINVLSPAPNFWVAYDGIYSKISEVIVLGAKPYLSVSTSNENKLDTDYRKMLHGAWLLVDSAIKFQSQNDADNINDYRDYIEKKEGEINSQLNEIAKWLGPVISDFSVDAELIVPTARESGIMPSQGGTILHYNVDARFSDKVLGVASGQCMPNNDYDDIIQDAIDENGDDNDWKLDDENFNNLKGLVKAMIQQESSWNPDAGSGAGAIGLMQIMPIEVAAAGKECQQEGIVNSNEDLKDPQKNIKCGVFYLKTLLRDFDKGGDINQIKLALAAYNCGPNCLKDAMDKADSDNWEKVILYVPKETQNYVPAVMSCYVFYSGDASLLALDKTIFTWPTRQRSVSGYCYWDPTTDSRTGYHMGMDISGKAGDDVKAIARGKVIDLKSNCKEGDTGCGKGYGNFVLIEHDSSFYSFYAHLEKDSIPDKIEKGDYAEKGSVIGKVGNTGYSKGAHLHLEIRRSKDGGMGNVMNPCDVLDCSGTRCSGSGEPLDIDYVAFLPESTENIYYYHDEANNRFVKKPFSLNVKIEDYIPALDCSKNNGKIFDMNGKNSILCYNNIIYFCGKGLKGASAANIKSEGLAVGSYTCEQGEWK